MSALTPPVPPPLSPASVRTIGITFRYLILSVLFRWAVSISAQVMPNGVVLLGLLVGVIFLLSTVVQAASAFLLARALGKHVALQILLTLLAVAPCLDLLALVWLNSDAKVALEKAGIKVGFMGPAVNDLPKIP